MLERVSTYSNLLIVGDINLHLDDSNDILTTSKFQQLLNVHSLLQHVSTATHSQGYTLDVVITRTEQAVESISVEAPSFSDHSLIVAFHIHILVSGRYGAAGVSWTLTVSDTT